VVTCSTDPLILHHTPTESHTIAWNITHMNFGPPLYTVTVTIYDLSGAVVRTLTIQQQPLGAGSTTWDGKKTNGQDAPKGIYTFKVYAAHPDCHDQDKVEAINNVSWTGLEWVTYPTRARVTLHYTLGQALSPCTVTVYKPNLADGTVYIPDGGNLSGTVGTHDVTVEFAVDLSVCGTYRLVITGTQATGSGNRDEVAKPAVPKGASVDIWPPGTAVEGVGVEFPAPHTMAAVMASMGADDPGGTATHYSVIPASPVAAQCLGAMRLGGWCSLSPTPAWRSWHWQASRAPSITSEVPPTAAGRTIRRMTSTTSP
jgi:hypothetical protein